MNGYNVTSPYALGNGKASRHGSNGSRHGAGAGRHTVARPSENALLPYIWQFYPEPLLRHGLATMDKAKRAPIDPRTDSIVINQLGRVILNYSNLGRLVYEDLQLPSHDFFDAMYFLQYMGREKTRKHNPNSLLVSHSFQVAETSLIYHRTKFGVEPSRRSTYVNLFHDGVEDFGMTYSQISLYCGEPAAQRVGLVTHDDRLNQIEDLFEKLYAKHKDGRERIPRFDFGLCLLKLFDTLHVVDSYTRQMKSGLLGIAERGKHSLKWHREHLEQRYLDIDCLAGRLLAIRSDLKMNPDRLPTHDVAKDLRRFFAQSAYDYVGVLKRKSGTRIATPDGLEKSMREHCGVPTIDLSAMRALFPRQNVAGRETPQLVHAL